MKTTPDPLCARMKTAGSATVWIVSAKEEEKASRLTLQHFQPYSNFSEHAFH